MRNFIKRIASVMLICMLVVSVIPAVTVEAAPRKLATPRITAVSQEPARKGSTYPTFKIEWNKVKGAARYQVYSADSWSGLVPAAKAEYKLVATVKANRLTSRRIPYGAYIKVKAVSGSVSSSFSRPADARSIPQPPAITGSSTNPANREVVQLSWTRVRRATGYQAMVSFKEASGYKAINVGKKTKADVKFLSTTPGKTQYFAVRAYTKKSGIIYYSIPSNSESAKPLKPPHVVDIVKVNEEFGKLLNAERARVGSRPVTYEPLNQAYANLRAEELKIMWSHVRPCGCNGHNGICPHNNIHPGRKILGENAHYSERTLQGVESDAEIARELFESWKDSPQHYAFMTSTGIWKGYTPNGGYFAVGVNEMYSAVFHLGATPR